MRNPRVRLVLLSFLMLFTELAMIRWTGSDIVYLSYFTNFVLLGSFLGIGIGFLRGRARNNLFPYAPVALSALVFLIVISSSNTRSLSESAYFQSPLLPSLPIWVILPVIFILAAAVMETIAEGVARQFAAFEALEAYRLDILGSIVGIAGFTLVSFFNAPPVVWGVVFAILWGVTALVPAEEVSPDPRRKKRATAPKTSSAMLGVQVVALGLLVLCLGIESLRPQTWWSPYHKVQVITNTSGVLQAYINGVPSQLIQSVDDMKIDQSQCEELLYYKGYCSFFFAPYLLRTDPEAPKQVLIIGAGTGRDTEVARRLGAEHVDAVEIEPRLAELGRTLNPDDPYANENVDLHVTDGRAFLESTDKKYDMIVFALPDSIALVSGQGGIRLESYLFTREAIEAAHEHLNPDGVFVAVNFFRERWVLDRLAGQQREVFGQQPCMSSLGEVDAQGVAHVGMATVGKNSGLIDCPTKQGNVGFDQSILAADASVPMQATDDWPFSFIKSRNIPNFYLLTIALILLLSFAAVKFTAGGVSGMRPYLDLFFMGAGFLLLETRNIVVFALLFGTTWLVNALVFGGILVAVLAAIEVAKRMPVKDRRRSPLWYGLLFASLAVAWAIPPDTLLSLDYAARLVAAIAIAFTPVFLANLIFAERFRESSSSTKAFGANLLGAMVGGILEYSAIIVGYRSLLILAGLLYAAAAITGRASGSAAPSEAPEVASGKAGLEAAKS